MAASDTSTISAPAPAPVQPSAPREFLTLQQLEEFARRLASSHTLSQDPRQIQPLLPRLDEAAARLEEAYQILTAEEPSVHRESSSSEDWVRDNFHVVDDQMREIRHDLPRRFYQQLVKLADGPSAGLPRVYVLASELIAHTEARLDLESLTRFSEVYQSVVPFSIGEVWAIPIMLRIGLVEELSRLADAVVETRRERQAARRWIARVKEREDVNPGWFDRFSSHWVNPKSALSAAFVVELLQWLRDEPPSILPAWQWLQERLDRQSTSADEMLRLEHQQEAARQLMLANVIGSMRLLSTLNWRAFFEQISLVERVLRGDPARAYGAMDFETADRYRRSVEQLARRSRRNETDVARQAVECAAAAKSDDLGSREKHIGYYLISRGRFAFEKQLGYRRSIRERAARFASRHPAIGYLGVIAGLLGLSLASLLMYGRRHGADTFDLVPDRPARDRSGKRARHQHGEPSNHVAGATPAATQAGVRRRDPSQCHDDGGGADDSELASGR